MLNKPLSDSESESGSSLGRKSLQVGRNTHDGLACHSARTLNRSQVTLEIFIWGKLLPSHTGNSRWSCPDSRSVANRSQASQVSRWSVASVSRRSDHGCGSGARVYADRRMACKDHGFASLSWCGRKTHLLLGQLYTFCLLVCQLLPDIDINALLQSDDKSLTTAHKYKKSRIFLLVHRS